MRTRFAVFSLIILFAAVASAQVQDKTLTFGATYNDIAIKEFTTTVRTLADIPELVADNSARTLTLHTTPDKIAIVEWLMHELDQAPSSAQLIGRYVVPGADNDVIEVIHTAHSDTPQGLTELVTTVRTIADVTRLFPYTTGRAIVMRGASPRLTMADWLFQQLDRAPNQKPSQPVAEFPRSSTDTDITAIYYGQNLKTNQALTEALTASRTVADCNRMFPIQALSAVAFKCPADRAALTEWIFGQLDVAVAPVAASPQQVLPGINDGVARIFFIPSPNDNRSLTGLITTIRTSTGINRIFPIQSVKAVVLRGTATQVASTERLIQDRGAANQ